MKEKEEEEKGVVLCSVVVLWVCCSEELQNRQDIMRQTTTVNRQNNNFFINISFIYVRWNSIYIYIQISITTMSKKYESNVERYICCIENII